MKHTQTLGVLVAAATASLIIPALSAGDQAHRVQVKIFAAKPVLSLSKGRQDRQEKLNLLLQ